MFEESICKTTWGSYFTQKIVVRAMMVGLGNILFCEAIKVDVAELEAKRQKNQLLRQKSAFKQYVFTVHTIWGFGMCYWIAWEICGWGYWSTFYGPKKNISWMDKKEEMIVNIFFLGRGLSMKPEVPTRNIWRCMKHGVYLHTESTTKICLQFWLNSA